MNATSMAGPRTGPTHMPREEAPRLARDEPLPGLSSEEAVAAVRGVLGAAGGSGPKTMTRAASDALSPSNGPQK
jgi:hypothetical protein